MTHKIREDLRKLGHSPDSIKSLRPAEAIAVVEAGVAPAQLETFVTSFRSPSEDTAATQQPQAYSEPADEPRIIVTPLDDTSTKREEPFDMKAVSFSISSGMQYSRVTSDLTSDRYF